MQHKEAIRALGNPNMRAVRAGTALDTRSAEKEARFQQALEEARQAEGQLTPSVARRIIHRESELPADVRGILAHHRQLVFQKRRATFAALYDRKMAPKKAEAIAAVRAAKVGKIPTWALTTIRFDGDLPEDVVTKRDDDSVAKERARKARERAPQRAQKVADAVKIIEFGKPGKYPATTVAFLNGEPGIPREIKQRLMRHAEIIKALNIARSNARASVRDRVRVQSNIRQAIEDARNRAEWPLSRRTVRRLNAQRRLPRDVRQVLAKHNEEIARRRVGTSRERQRDYGLSEDERLVRRLQRRQESERTKIPELETQIEALTRDLSLSLNGHSDEMFVKYRKHLGDKQIKDAVAHSELPISDVIIINLRNRLQDRLNRLKPLDDKEIPHSSDRWEAAHY